MARWNQSKTWRTGPELAASPKARGPTAPSLRTVTGVCGVIPRLCSTPLNCWRCLSASAKDAAEHDLLTIVIANVSDKDLERATLITVCRSDMAAINRDCHRLCWCRRRRVLRRRQRFRSNCARREVFVVRIVSTSGGSSPSAEKLRQKPACVRRWGHPCTQFGYDALVLGGATVRHDLRNRRERAPRPNAATAGLEPRRAHFDCPEQRVQPPTPDVLQRALLLATHGQQRRSRQ